MKSIFILFIFTLIFAGHAKTKQELTHRLEKPAGKSAFTGDMRLRYQHSFLDINTTKESGYFVRLRGAIAGGLSDALSWKFGMASGGWVNSNQEQYYKEQRLGGFSVKPLWFDTAVLSYQPTDHWTVQLGKMENPYFDSHRYNLIWDPDLNPEGLSIGYSTQFMKNHSVNFDLSSFLRDTALNCQLRPEALSGDQENACVYDKFLLAGSARFLMDYDNYDFRTGVSFYNIQSKGDWVSSEDQSVVSNSLISDDSQKYLYNYSILDIFFQMNLKNLWKPLSLSVQLVQNFAVQDASMGMIAGGFLGDRKKVHSWSLGYHFFQLDKDATLAKYTDSDVSDVGVNYSGHQVNLSYLLNRSTSLGLKYIARKDKSGEDKNKFNHIFYGSLSIQI